MSHERHKAIAYHEAGHAVAADSFDIAIASCQIDLRKDDEHGSTEFVTGVTGKQALVIAWAGPLAEMKVDPYANVAASDQEAIKKALHDFRGTYPQMMDEVCAAAKEAYAIVERGWPRISRVGDALLEHGSLTGDQIRKIANG